MYARTYRLDFIASEELTEDLKSQNKSQATIARVPIPRNLHGSFLIRHGIEGWLLEKTSRKGSPFAFADQIEFRLLKRSEKDNPQ